MAAKPIERFVKRQIADQGGWDRILERIASGETIADIARTLKRPDGQLISRNFLSTLLHQDPERSAKVKAAHLEGAGAMVDDALHLVDTAQVDRDSVNKAKVQAEMRVKIAGFKDRESWGEKGTQVNLLVQTNELHLGALRHREQLAATSSRKDTDVAVLHTPETQDLAVSNQTPVQEVAVRSQP